MRYGVARGLFANEAGMGSTPHAHAVAKVDHPCEQGLVAIFGVFTVLIIVTFTALVILVSGVYKVGPDLLPSAHPTGIQLTQLAYSVDMSNFGAMFVGICLFFFAFSTIVGWYFFGAQNVRFLFNEAGVKYYRVIVALNKVVAKHLREFEGLLDGKIKPSDIKPDKIYTSKGVEMVVTPTVAVSPSPETFARDQKNA